MIRNVLTHTSGISLYGVLSICLFFAAFLGVLAWTLRLKKPYLNSMRALPLDEGEPAPPSSPQRPNPEPHHE